MLTAGCGYVSDSPVKDSGLFVSDELSGCVIDPDSFGQILEKDIEQQIDCLEKSLIQFSKYVRSSSKGSIGHGELSDFIKEIFKENSQTIIKGLGLIFELNMILMRDEATQISHDNITPLMKILLKTNREAIIITNIIKVMSQIKSKERFYEERAKLKGSLLRFSLGLQEVLKKKSSLPRELNIKEFLMGLEEKLGTEIDEDLVDSLIFIKRLFLGGKRQTISSSELISLVNKAPRILLSAFDMIYVKSDFMESTNELITFYQNRIKDIEKEVVKLNPDEEVFSIAELFKIARRVQDSTEVMALLRSIGIDEYEQIILQFKEDMIGGDRKIVRYSEMKTMFLYIQLLFEATKSLVNINDIVTDLENKDSDYVLSKKENFNNEVVHLTTKLKKLIGDGKDLPNNFYVFNFIKQISESIEDLNIDINLIDAGLSLKKIIIGGIKEVVTKKELLKSLDNLNEYASIYYDVVYLAPTFKSDADLYKVGIETIRKIETLIYPWQDKERLLHINDIVTAFKAFAPSIDIKKFQESIIILKEKLISQTRKKDVSTLDDSSFFTAYDIKTIVQFLKEAIENVYFSEVTYIDKKEILESIPTQLTSIEFNDLEEYKIFSAEDLEKQKNNFLFILKNFRFFISKDMIPFYNQDIKRTKKGFVFTTFLHWAFTKVSDGYAEFDEKTQKKQLDIPRLENLLLDIKPLLEYFNLWSEDFKTFVRNVILLGDLFQNNSNGDFKLSADEATEYVAMIFTSVKISKDIMAELIKKCENVGTEEDQRYELDCYRKNFFKILFYKLDYGKYFSKLQDYDDEASLKDTTAYLMAVEAFARDVDLTEPMGIRDFTLVIGAMLNIETTFIRYDLNNDNILDLDELKEAFKVYKNAIMDIADLKGWKERFALPAFLYMVKEMEKPGFFDLLSYLNPWYKVRAQRVNIGALLAYLVKIPQEKAEEEANEKFIGIPYKDLNHFSSIYGFFPLYQ